MMIKKLFALSLITAMIGFTSCSKDDKDSGDASAKATINGKEYSYEVSDGIYSTVTEKLVVDMHCSECPPLNITLFGDLNPGVLTSGGSQADGTFTRIQLEENVSGGTVEFNADTATVEITSHNESDQTISGTFSFEIDQDWNSENYNYSGTGSFNNLYYD